MTERNSPSHPGAHELVGEENRPRGGLALAASGLATVPCPTGATQLTAQEACPALQGVCRTQPPMTGGSLQPTEGPSGSMELWGLEGACRGPPRTSLT